MLKMVDGTGIIGVDMICPLGVSTPQPPNYDRVELEGVGMLVLPNSLDAPLERLELGGKTEQVQTTGKNLFDPNNNYEDLVWIRNDGEIVGGSNARTSDYIPVEQGNYAFQFDVINYNQMFVAGYNTGKQFVKIVGTISRGKCIIKIDNIEIETIRLSYTRESTRIQLERSETQTPYEPYTGGKPSPSPEYPQEIKNSGKWNEEKQKYEVTVKINNANLLNEEDFFDMGNWKSYQYHMDLAPNTKYTFSRKDNSGINSGLFLSIKETAEGTWSQIINSNSASSCKQKVTFTTNESGKIYFLIQNNESVNLKDFPGYAQLEVGTIVTQHMKYTEQPLTLTSDRPITKWDRLVEQGGEIGWLYKHKIIEDFSTLVKDTEPIYGNDGGKYFSVSLQNASLNYDRSKIYSEVGIYGKDNKKYYIPQPLVASTIINVSDTDTIMTAKEHMHYKVVYETVDSEFIPLSQDQQDAIRALKTYYPTTVITADGGELDPDIKVTYRKEI